MSDEMQDRAAIVTGAASGIGAQIARTFALAGARLVLVDRDAATLGRIAAELDAVAVIGDVGHESTAVAAVSTAVERFGAIHALVNNAGGMEGYGAVEALDVARFDAAVATMLRGPLLAMKHAAPYMKRRRDGAIVSIASVAGLVAGYGTHVYTAVKHGLVGLTRSAAMELGRHGIRVNAICPGGILTPLGIATMGGGEAGERAARRYLETLQPIPRAGLPADVAAAALYLCGPGATFVNGTTVVVDGGATAGLAWTGFFETAPGASA